MRRIFIHIPRTAGNTIKGLFPDLMVWSHDLRGKDYGFFSKQKDDFVFAFMRDPLTRFLSAYFYLKRGGRKESDNLDGYFTGIRAMSPVEFVTKRLREVAKWQIHFLPQIVWMKNVKPDFIGRYENMEEDYSELCKKLKIEKKSLQYKPTSKDITETEIRYILPIIKDVYKEDYKYLDEL